MFFDLSGFQVDLLQASLPGIKIVSIEPICFAVAQPSDFVYDPNKFFFGVLTLQNNTLTSISFNGSAPLLYPVLNKPRILHSIFFDRIASAGAFFTGFRLIAYKDTQFGAGEFSSAFSSDFTI